MSVAAPPAAVAVVAAGGAAVAVAASVAAGAAAADASRRRRQSAASAPRALKPAGTGDVTSSWCRQAHGSRDSGSKNPGLRQRVSWSAD